MKYQIKTLLIGHLIKSELFNSVNKAAEAAGRQWTRLSVWP